MATRHLKRLQQRERRAGPAVALRIRRLARIALLLFLGVMLIGLTMMVVEMGVPSIAWPPS